MGPSNGHQLLVLIAVALAGGSMDSAAAQQGSPSGGPGPNYFDPKNISPNMAVVMVVLVMAFFLLGFFSIYLRRCAGPPLGEPDEYPSHNRRHGIGGITYASRSRRAPRGLDRAVLESFPTMAYADVKTHKVGKGGALECAVCLSEFDDDDTLRLLPRCAHVFHADCIDAWLASHVTCPVCRAVLAPNYESPAHPPASATVSTATEQDALPQQPAAPDTAMASEQAVVVVVDAEEMETEEERIRREEAAELMRIGSVKRALRSKSSGRRPAAFRRSHTTGHSLAAAQPPAAADETAERYTLRLPENVLREVVAAGNLRRSASVQTGGSGGGSARRGRSVRLGSSSGRWPNVSMLARTFSARLPAWGSMRRGEGDALAKGAKVAGDGRDVEQCDGGACPLGAHV